ncbi:DoxX family protein [Emticicia fontis]
MKTPTRIGNWFYGIALVVYGLQQLWYANFRTVQLPAWQTYLPLLPVWAYLTGIGLILAGLAIMFDKKARETSLLLGSIFLFLFLLVQIPYEMFGDPNSSLHLGVWTNALKGLALAGGAFVMAGTFTKNDSHPSSFFKLAEKLIPFGPLFFSITMISFGLAHLLYAEGVSTLVPSWMPDPVFWTYLTGVVLIGSGFSITLKIRRGAIALLFSIVLFIWVFSLHLPRAINDPTAMRGNEVSSCFDALAFCGIALVISLKTVKKDLTEIFES